MKTPKLTRSVWVRVDANGKMAWNELNDFVALQPSNATATTDRDELKAQVEELEFKLAAVRVAVGDQYTTNQEIGK